MRTDVTLVTIVPPSGYAEEQRQAALPRAARLPRLRPPQLAPPRRRSAPPSAAKK